MRELHVRYIANDQMHKQELLKGLKMFLGCVYNFRDILCFMYAKIEGNYQHHGCQFCI